VGRQTFLAQGQKQQRLQAGRWRSRRKVSVLICSGEGGAEGVFVNGVGNMGINNASPGYKLDVIGIINASTAVKVNTIE
jgi:hypothetical protein